MIKEKDLFVVMSMVATVALILTTSIGIPFDIANGQMASCDNGELNPSPSSHVLPVILVHGYREDSSIWYEWEQNLESDGIQFCLVSFHPDDICGTALDDASELSQIVQRVKSMTLQNQVNIVAHSKGGLDVRVYLAMTGTHDVANLIMIGTPNAGSPLADFTEYYNSDPFCPAVRDFTTYAWDINSGRNTNTKYHTIAGDWYPDYEGNPYIPGHDDGWVAVKSVESQPYFHSLGHTLHKHLDLLSNIEYGLAQHILLGR